MALAKHYEEILMRRRENGALIVDEFLRPQESQKGALSNFQMSPEQLATLRAFVQRATRACKERLAREMALVFRLNKERTMFWAVGYLIKGEAAEIASIPGGMMLDLDPLYREVNIFNDHLCISEAKLADVLERYGTELTSAELIERLAD